MEMNNIVLMSISQDMLREIIKESVREEMSFKKESELLSFNETCQLLGCSRSGLNKWKSENRIKFKN
jgi:hypothetical protein